MQSRTSLNGNLCRKGLQGMQHSLMRNALFNLVSFALTESKENQGMLAFLGSNSHLQPNIVKEDPVTKLLEVKRLSVIVIERLHLHNSTNHQSQFLLIKNSPPNSFYFFLRSNLGSFFTCIRY